jgi:fluoroquinolone transport system permease protein
MKQFISLGLADFRLIFRDPTLRIFLILPLAIFIVVDFLLPFLIKEFPVIGKYAPYIVIVAVFETTQMFGFIYSMVLLEEKENEVSKVYGVLPVSKAGFTLSRFIIPVILTTLICWLLLFTQPFYQFSILKGLYFSVVASLLVPTYAIGISLFSANRLEGLVWIKVFNIIVVLPAVAFFVPGIFSDFFGILPTHWFFQSLYGIFTQGDYIMNLTVAGIYSLLLIIITIRIFSRRHFS